MRNKLRSILEFQSGDNYTLISKVVNYLIIILILLSSISIFLENHFIGYEKAFKSVDLAFTIFFTIEYLLRVYSAKDRLKYIISFFAIIDLLAILPGFLLLNESFRHLRIIRLVRLIRIIKIFRYINFEIWYDSINKKIHISSLFKVFIITLIIWVISSNLLYFIEDNSGMDYYFNSYWKILIVLISGFDIEGPKTVLAKFEIIIVLFLGITFVSIITGEVVSILMNIESRKGKVSLLSSVKNLTNHIVIINKNNSLNNIIEQIVGAYNNKYYIIIVAQNAKDIPIIEKKRKKDGNNKMEKDSYRNIYKKVFAIDANLLHYDSIDLLNLENAKTIMILPEEGVKDDNRSLMFAMAVVNRIKDKKSKARITVELNNKESIKYSKIFKSDIFLSQESKISFINSIDFGEKLLANSVINKNVTQIYDPLMTFTGDTNEFYKQMVIEEFFGTLFGDLQIKLMELENSYIILFGIQRPKEENFFIPDYNYKLSKDECLVFLAYNYDPGESNQEGEIYKLLKESE